MSDLSGEIIDSRYQLQKLIATGGMASIYEAIDIRLDRHVAVKIMHPHLANDEEYVTRFIREAKAAASLSHPNVVAIQDQGWNEGGVPAIFLVMELIEGFTLRELMHEKGALSIKEALRYFSPVLSALVAAHKLGVVHRDIKPENILISKDGRVKVADFGLARAATTGATMTIESSIILGSVSYLSPEQVSRGVSDARSDVYALGIVLFEMLTGQRPFEGDSPIQIAYKHVNERVPAPSTLKASITDKVDHIVLKATAPNPDQRYRDAAEMERDIQKIERELEPAKRQLSLELDVAPVMILEKKRKKVLSTPKESEPPMREKTNSSKEIKRKKKTSGRVKRNRFLALLIVAALLFAGWNMVGGGAKVEIPSLVGLSVKQATATLQQLGLSADIREEIFSEETKPGLVLASDPGGGGKVSVNGTVHLTLSKGPERITVPDIAGASVDDAIKAIKEAGLIVGTSTRAFSESIAKDSVVNTSPEIGTPLRRSSAVNIVISDGQALGGKSYVGLFSDQALNEINDAGFTVNTIYAYSESVAVGMVISQTLPTTIKAGQKPVVTIVVSQGTAYAYVPDGLRGRTLKEATAAIEGLGLKVAKPKIIGTRKNKVVINVSPAEKTKVKPGSTVTLTLG
ncbi:MAG: Stk1 family PASTA domain-containing Ser/Thr kinase [Actinobacteria bacterium]|nr:Stk1 family PASTA domain-containing Ser/Thr kinase [Actinomycetota bacterium]